MIWLLKPDHPKATEFAPAMDDSTGILPGLPAVKGKPVHVAFDGGRMTSDAGVVLLAAVEQPRGLAEGLGVWLEAPRARERVNALRDGPHDRPGHRFGNDLFNGIVGWVFGS